MAQKALKCDQIGKLDSGAVELMVNKALARIYEDLDDRGEDGQARKLVLTLAFKRRANSEVEVKPEVKVVGPAYSGAGTTCVPAFENGEPVLRFSEHSPDNPHQRTIDEALDDEDERRRDAGNGNGQS